MKNWRLKDPKFKKSTAKLLDIIEKMRIGADAGRERPRDSRDELALQAYVDRRLSQVGRDRAEGNVELEPATASQVAEPRLGVTLTFDECALLARFFTMVDKEFDDDCVGARYWFYRKWMSNREFGIEQVRDAYQARFKHQNPHFPEKRCREIANEACGLQDFDGLRGFFDEDPRRALDEEL